ncbi:MAG TPA: GNAT family N-acetyltransferase [Rhodanobacter sp.]|nr:GNAT family N-acetyltransferase [Rhodanobacter sp.]
MSHAAPATAYHTRVADLGRDRAAIVAFWQANLGDPTHRAAKFDWFYANNPFGQPTIQLLYHGDTLVGCCGVAPRRMLWQGREIRAGLLADMAVDAAHRTLGPALMLHEALAASTAGQFDLLYGFPNHKSLPVVARLGYTVLGDMTRHSRVLRSAPYLRRHLPRWLAAPAGTALDVAMAVRDRAYTRRGDARTITWSSTADLRMDALWQTSRHDDGLVGIRDHTLLRWRFDEAPQAGTRFLLVGATADGPLHAWFACQVAGTVLRVCDYWCKAGRTGIGRALPALVRTARRSGYTSISLECAAPRAVRIGAGFVPRDHQPVIARWLGSKAAREPLQDYIFTNMDEDE